MSIRFLPVPTSRNGSPVQGIFAALALIEEARACMRAEPDTAAELLAEARRRLDGAPDRQIRLH
jgi:hypothetical protein